jgi:hypothetical protein
MERIVRELCDLKVRELELNYELSMNKKEQARLEELKRNTIPAKEEAILRETLVYIGTKIPGSHVLMNLIYKDVGADTHDTHDNIYGCKFFSITMTTSRYIREGKVEERHTIIIETLNKQIEQIVQSFFRQEGDTPIHGAIRRIWYQSPADGRILIAS